MLDDLRDLGVAAGRDRRQHARPLRPRLRQPGVPAGRDLGPRALPDDDRAHRRAPAGRDPRRGPAPRRRARRGPRWTRRTGCSPTARRSTSRGREVRLAYLGRGHTDNDIVVSIPDADVLCAGDLLENGNPPYFGDGYPMDWPATVEAMLAMAGRATVVVPGHGDIAGRSFVTGSLAAIRSIAELARRVARRRAGPRGGDRRRRRTRAEAVAGAARAGPRPAARRARCRAGGRDRRASAPRGLRRRRGPPSGRAPAHRRSRRARAPACRGRPP